ncbi:MAG: FAD-dependent oxidoreductase [Candidatus Peregrinibacteria bacterium]|nr:FAD-dependent oxidoreductase [Candidatus Peregrinibacteria bacterium]MCB9807788.1 FAD-dependent oxidoreductase [Candidatus Peribacteria bacterium]
MQFLAPIVSRKIIANNTVEVVCKAHSAFSFKAGQYVTVTIPALSDRPIRERFRDFSIASSPSEPSKIAFSFRTSPHQSPYKHYITTCPIGTELEVEGPKGVFTLPDNLTTPLVFIAGGVGVTPFLSMICFATETQSPQQIHLITSNSSPDRAVYIEEIRTIADNNPHVTLTEHIGRIDANFLREEITLTTKNALWYIAGPPAMVHTIQTMLEHEGIHPANLRSESFTGYA